MTCHAQASRQGFAAWRTLLAVAASALLSITAQAAVYSIEAIGPVGAESFAAAINNRGQVVLNVEDPTDGWGRHAWVYQPGLGSQDLGLGRSEVYDINDAGVIVGGVGENFQFRAFAYSLSQAQTLGVALAGATSYATAINNRGDVGISWLGGLVEASPALVGQLDGSPLKALPMPKGIDSSSHINDINNAGVAVGSGFDASYDDLIERAFVASLDGTALQVFEFPEGAVANAINDAGVIVGHVGNMDRQAFVFRPDQGVEIMPAPRSNAMDINNQGWIVGTVDFNEGFLYVPGIGMSSLQALLPERSGWTRLAATSINDQGQIIGTGLLHGTTNTAFIMSLSGAVPEPGTWAFMAMGLIGVAGAVRRCRAAPNA